MKQDNYDEYYDNNIDHSTMKTTIRLQASLNYQVAEITTELPSNVDDNTYNNTINWAKGQVISLVQDLNSKIESTSKQVINPQSNKNNSNNNAQRVNTKNVVVKGNTVQNNTNRINTFYDSIVSQITELDVDQGLPKTITLQSPYSAMRAKYAIHQNKVSGDWFYAIIVNLNLPTEEQNKQLQPYFNEGFPKFINITARNISGGAFTTSMLY